jgi:hypothetical protein
MSNLYRTIPINDWSEFRQLASSEEFRSWAFRGQKDARWPIYSSLSRYFLDFNVHKDAWEFQEKRVVRIFKRQAHLFLTHVPLDDSDFEWLALMQHHGTPTRLIDFTWSPFVAAFFALQNAIDFAAIWAIFPPNIDHSHHQVIRGGEIIDAPTMWLRNTGNYGKHFLPGNKPFVITGEPHIMNQRLIAQHGTFAVPGKLDEPLEAILSDYEYPEKVIVKFELNTKIIRDTAMKDLYDSNISDATLFPGIDGMARSLAFELEFHWAYNPKTMVGIPGFENPPMNKPAKVKKKSP